MTRYVATANFTYVGKSYAEGDDFVRNLPHEILADLIKNGKVCEVDSEPEPEVEEEPEE